MKKQELGAGPGGARQRLQVHPVVFCTSAVLILAFSGLTLVFLEQAEQGFALVQTTIARLGGWFYVLSVNVFLIFVVWLALGKYGKIRIGGNQAIPDYTRWEWFAMLFSAGMGIGLLFYSVAEPIYHYIDPPRGEGGTAAAARNAMAVTFFHWGFHAWSVYGLVSVAFAFFTYNRGLPLTVRSIFYPLLGERIHGWIGNLIDILAVVATLFGIATSLGLGVQQINSGLSRVAGIPSSEVVQLVLIAGVTGLATLSVVLGLDRGIKRLSEWTMGIAALLLLFVLICGPTLFLLKAFVQNTGHYLERLTAMSTWTAAYTETDWLQNWTIFYWAWWIAWSPFVGMFIARISRGRTIRELLIGVLLAPTMVTFVWLTVFGNSALYEELFGSGGIAVAVQSDMPSALFVLLEHFPWSVFSCWLAVLVVIGFFVTSSDSGSLVIDIITSGGHLDPPVWQRIFWSFMEGAVAAVLLLGGGLVALQTGAIITGLPFTIILWLMCWSLVRGLRSEISEE